MSPPPGERRSSRQWVAPPLPTTLAAAALWSVLCMLLAWGGHSPSGPTPMAHWYGVQAVLVWAVVPAQGVVAGRVGAWIAGEGPAARADVALAWGRAVLVFVGLDLVAFGVGGFDALSKTLPVSASMGVLVGVGTGVVRLRSRGVGIKRALRAAIGGLVVAAAVGSPLLR